MGNTRAHLALFVGTRVVARRFLDTPRGALTTRERARIVAVARRAQEAVVGSVVAEGGRVLAAAIEEGTGRPPRVAGRDLPPPLPIRYRPASAAGVDRVADAAAALRLLGAPAVAVDLGSATTFNVVDRRGRFAGGAILAGLTSFAEALRFAAPRLPRFPLLPPRRVIGRDTRQSLRSGTLLGYAALIDGMLRRIAREIGRPPRVVATGGSAPLVVPLCREVKRIDPDLTLKGLLLFLGESRG